MIETFDGENDSAPHADEAGEHEDTVARPRPARPSREAVVGPAPEDDDTVAIPGPLRRGAPGNDAEAGPTSDTHAAHRAQRRRAQPADPAERPGTQGSTAHDADPVGPVDAGAAAAGGRAALVPNLLAVEQYPARAVAPVIAARAPRPIPTPQPLRDGTSIDRSIRGNARRRAAGLGALITGGILVAVGLLAIAVATSWS